VFSALSMKNLTVWQRMNLALLLLAALLVTGVGLALYLGEARSDILRRADQLSAKRDRIDRALTLISESLHRPGLDLDAGRRSEAERDLKAALDFIQTAFRGEADLRQTASEVRDFAMVTLASFQKRMLDLNDSDPAGTAAFYNKNYPAVSRERDRLVNELSRVIIGVQQAEGRRADTVLFLGLGGIGAVLFLSLLVGRLQSKALNQPMSQLVEALQRMRRGDFTHRLGWATKDPFGVISQGLDSLASDLKDLVGQVQRSGTQVNSSATDIADTTRQQQGAAAEIAATTTQIGNTSKQISTTSQELLKTLNEVSRGAEETGGLAGSGQAAIARMGGIMRQIMEAGAAINAKLGVLSEKTGNINTVATTITKVADQTNLLSLNAAIEAEKAGEYGLGFTVVAMEIRRLADQTAVAAYDIEKMVKEMQSAVAAGVMGMERFAGEVRQGVEEVQKVSADLAQIIHQVQLLTPRFQVVNAGMQAQANSAQHISSTLGQLGEAAQKTAELLLRSNSAIDQLNAAARGLQTSVSRFRLGDTELR